MFVIKRSHVQQDKRYPWDKDVFEDEYLRDLHPISITHDVEKALAFASKSVAESVAAAAYVKGRYRSDPRADWLRFAKAVEGPGQV